MHFSTPQLMSVVCRQCDIEATDLYYFYLDTVLPIEIVFLSCNHR